MVRKIGNNIDMEYSASSSGAWLSDAVDFLKDKLKYSSVKHYGGDTYSEIVILEELRAGRPVMITGFTKEGFLGMWWGKGHTWVLDGFKYQASTNKLLLHCNWGWRGTSNGYFYSDVFKTRERIETVEGIDTEGLRDDNLWFIHHYRMLTVSK